MPEDKFKSLPKSFSSDFSDFVYREQEIRKKLYLVSVFRVVLQLVLILSTALLTLDSGF
ncbi:MAG: hypothetical protein FJ088_03160, partial [Deltaproteobacteria bacterium]|nr:hypothetical protein [Deltaproteobacteria bacterium]